MLILASVFAALAAAMHVVIFVLESLAWESPRARETFSIDSIQEARATKFMAFNQGFYNLMLAVVAALGVIVWLAGATAVGATLLLTGTGSMLAAAVLLFVTSAPHRRAAVMQGLFPLLAVLTGLVALIG